LLVNGEVKGTGTGKDVLGSPLNALLWLANSLSSYGLGLKKGDIISTGSCTGLQPFTDGDLVQAVFTNMGKEVIADFGGK